MDQIQFWNPDRRSNFVTVTGRITRISSMQGRGGNACSQFITVEDSGGNITNFIVTPETYIADCATLRQRMQAHFIYDANSPAPAIFPPQYRAVAVVPVMSATNVFMGFFNNRLVNAENTLRLNLNADVPVVTSNNQMFSGSPGGRILLVLYENSTRSIPAQTTPERVGVMCDM